MLFFLSYILDGTFSSFHPVENWRLPFLRDRKKGWAALAHSPWSPESPSSQDLSCQVLKFSPNPAAVTRQGVTWIPSTAKRRTERRVQTLEVMEQATAAFTSVGRVTSLGQRVNFLEESNSWTVKGRTYRWPREASRPSNQGGNTRSQMFGKLNVKTYCK